MQHGNGWGLGLSIALGLIGAGGLVGNALTHMKTADRYVTVKGLVERDVKSNLAVWPLRFKATGNDLAEVQALVDAQRQKVQEFLSEQGFTEADIVPADYRLVDKQAREYDDGQPKAFRYVLEATVTVRSADVDRVQKASQSISSLLKSGVGLTEDNACQAGPRFSFTALNDIKPEMLAESTRNARAAAEQFAADSQSKVGAIRQANQGVFSITPRDGSEGDCQDHKSIDKQVRVVTTVDYYLEQ